MPGPQKLPPNARPFGLSNCNGIRQEPPSRTQEDMKNSTMNKALKALGITPSPKDSILGGEALLVPTGPGDRPRTTTQSLHPFSPQTTDHGYGKRKSVPNLIDYRGGGKGPKRPRDADDDEMRRTNKKPKQEQHPPRPTISKKPPPIASRRKTAQRFPRSPPPSASRKKSARTSFPRRKVLLAGRRLVSRRRMIDVLHLSALQDAALEVVIHHRSLGLGLGPKYCVQQASLSLSHVLYIVVSILPSPYDTNSKQICVDRQSNFKNNPQPSVHIRLPPSHALTSSTSILLLTLTFTS
ncbi:hypothetical protein CPB85DRAFT_1459099, partial [Mucidula mucida]